MSRPRPSPARRQALEEARRSERQAALTAHCRVLGEIAAGAAAGGKAGSHLFEGFFEALAEDARQLFETRMAEIDEIHRPGGGQLPPAMKS